VCLFQSDLDFSRLPTEIDRYLDGLHVACLDPGMLLPLGGRPVGAVRVRLEFLPGSSTQPPQALARNPLPSTPEMGVP